MISDPITTSEATPTSYADLLLLARKAQLAGLHDEAKLLRRLIEKMADQADGGSAG